MARKWLFLVMLALAVITVACAPSTTPPTSTRTPQPTPSVSIPSTVSPSPEDAAWARVIEAGRKEGSVTVYGYTFMGDLNQAMSNAFFKKYGIRTDIITGPGAMFAEKIRTEQRMGSVIVDVTEWGPGFAINLF